MPEAHGEPLSRHRYLTDAFIAALVLAITLNVPTEGGRAFDGPGLALAALAALPLLGRRREPFGALVLVGGASTALVWLGYVDGSAPGLLVACYSLAVSSSALARTFLTGATVVGLLLLHMVALKEATAAGYSSAPLFGLFWGIAWLVGDRVRERRERIGGLEKRASRTISQDEASTS